MIEIDGYHLSINDLLAVAKNSDKVTLAESALKAIETSHGWVKAIQIRGEPVYGINTGFGIFADTAIAPEDSARLSRNLILSHAVGTGPDLPLEITRAAMLVRANTLAKGFSGVRPIVVSTLLDMLNRGLTPLVPSQGSLGSSGDLAPLAHLALVLTRGDETDEDESNSGRAVFSGETLTGKEAMRRAGIEQVELGAKEGLAITNGATFSAAAGAMALAAAEILVLSADLALAMSMEALRGCSDAFDPRIHVVRGQKGQLHAANLVRKLLLGSNLVDATGRVQDAYSLRCAPQVHGSVRDTLNFVKETIQQELNAATDNPLIFDPGVALSGGNFHGEPVGLAMDYLGIAVTELAAISERRTYRLTDPALNGGLPPMLVDSIQAGGLNSGLMMPQYTAASLVLENRTLATPDTINSLPTSGGQEDHNANAMTAARHAIKIVENSAYILAVETYTAARALFLRLREDPGLRLGEGTRPAYELIQSRVPYQPGDALWGPEIETVKDLIVSGELLGSAGLSRAQLR